MNDFKETLRKRLAYHGLARQYDASIVCDVAQKVSAGRFEPVSFRGGVLKIRVPSASRAHLVRLRQKEIILEVNKRLGGDKVERIRIEID